MTKSLYPLFGIVTVLNTPFKADGAIDYAALRKNVREALVAGVTGFLVPAMDAELFEYILPVLAFSNQHLEISIPFFKRLLYRQGMYPSPLVRNPALPFDAYHEKTADRLIRRVVELENRIKNQRAGP